MTKPALASCTRRVRFTPNNSYRVQLYTRVYHILSNKLRFATFSMFDLKHRDCLLFRPALFKRHLFALCISIKHLLINIYNHTKNYFCDFPIMCMF